VTTIHWVRHGPTHAKSFVGWTALPADLSDRDQIARLDEYLPDDALVVSSDLARARATADAIAAARARLLDMPDIREIHFGDWEMQRFDQIEDQDHLTRFWDHPGDVTPPSGESWNALTTRVERAVEALCAAHTGDIIAVAHFGVIVTQIQMAQEISAYEAFANKIHNFSVTTVTYGKTRTAGVINHLP